MWYDFIFTMFKHTKHIYGNNSGLWLPWERREPGKNWMVAWDDLAFWGADYKTFNLKLLGCFQRCVHSVINP